MYCENCGKEIQVDLPGMDRNPFPGMQIKNYNPYLDYQPIGMWGYFFYSILFMLPVIGWICIILFSVGVTRNVNLRNYARSYLCIYIIAAVFVIMLIVAAGGLSELSEEIMI